MLKYDVIQPNNNTIIYMCCFYDFVIVEHFQNFQNFDVEHNEKQVKKRFFF